MSQTAIPPNQEIVLGHCDDVEILPEESRSESGTPLGNGPGKRGFPRSMPHGMFFVVNGWLIGWMALWKSDRVLSYYP